MDVLCRADFTAGSSRDSDAESMQTAQALLQRSSEA